MNVRAVMLALFIAAALIICALRPAEAAPALWVVQSSSGGKIYLFGTVHLLREETQWRTPELDAAVKESQDLYLEIADPRTTPSNITALLEIGFDRQHPLSTKISKADVELLDEAAKRYGYGGEAAFEPMRPWLAFLVLSTLPAVHSGYSAASGVDLQIRKNFVDAGKPVHGLETVDMQAHVFADMPEAAQIALLEAQLKNISQQKSVTNLDTIVNAWLSGNEDDLAASLQIEKLSQSPIFAKVYTDRNKAWAAALAERLKQPGTSFVCVGAGHLVGPGGLPTLLAHMGYTVTRVQLAETRGPAAASPVPVASLTPAAAPTPAPSPGVIPATLTPPPGWTARAVSFAAGPFKADRMWIDPKRRGGIMLGHLDLPGVGTMDLDTLDAAFHQGLSAAQGVKDVQPSTHVKICNGGQSGTYTKATLVSVKEDVVLTLSDRGYPAQYIRRNDSTDDPAAMRSLLSLCAPQSSGSPK